MQYRKLPVIIEAVQISQEEPAPPWLSAAFDNTTVTTDGAGGVYIKTLEGLMRGSPGDWIIKGVNGELYPCKPEIFEKTYERVDGPLIVSAGDLTDYTDEEMAALMQAPTAITYMPRGGGPIAEDDSRHPKQRYSRFEEVICGAINGCSMENGSDTPDFILASFMVANLKALDQLSQYRDKWYGAPRCRRSL